MALVMVHTYRGRHAFSCQVRHGNQNYHLMMSDYNQVPRKVTSLSMFVITQIASGMEHMAVITSLGWIHIWGDNRRGQTGHGKDVKFLSSPKALSVLSTKQITSVSGGCSHTACISKAGELYTWGRGGLWIARSWR